MNSEDMKAFDYWASGFFTFLNPETPTEEEVRIALCAWEAATARMQKQIDAMKAEKHE